MQPAIEHLLLAHGRRGIERLACYLPPDYAARAAQALGRSPRVLITTGFFVDGHPETDGPPGAFFLGRALAELGASICFVAERSVLELLKGMVETLWSIGPGGGAHRSGGSIFPHLPCPDFVEFPVADVVTSRALCAELIFNRQPGAVVAIERCGRTRSGRYRNMLGTDISRWTSRVDELFTYPGIVTVGVGDGGNELGMGLLAQHVSRELGLTDPVQTAVDHLVVATVSNWGAYGIIAYLSSLAGRDLLPAYGEDAQAVEMMLAQGAIDGFTRQAEPTVDGFPIEVTSALIGALRREEWEVPLDKGWSCYQILTR